MTTADQYREYLTGLAAGITAVTTQDRTNTDGAEVLATAGLLRWSGRPKDPGWKPTAAGRHILHQFRQKRDPQ